MLYIEDGYFDQSSRSPYFYVTGPYRSLYTIKKDEEEARFLCFTGRIGGFAISITNPKSFNKTLIYLLLVLGAVADLFGEEFKDLSTEDMINTAYQFIQDIKSTEL